MKFAFRALPVLLVTIGVASAPQEKKNIPMRDVDLRGQLRVPTHELDAYVKVAIATPIGNIPISGHIEMTYACDASFKGKVSYNPIVRFFAKIKGVDLVTQLDGGVKSDSTFDCAAVRADSLNGKATVDVKELSGYLKIRGDSVPFKGPAWTIGDSTYHSDLVVTRAGKTFQVRVNMYER